MGYIWEKLTIIWNEMERDNLIESAVYLQNSLGFKIMPLYIKDMSRDKIIAASTDGIDDEWKITFYNARLGWYGETGDRRYWKVLKLKGIESELK